MIGKKIHQYPLQKGNNIGAEIITIDMVIIDYPYTSTFYKDVSPTILM